MIYVLQLENNKYFVTKSSVPKHNIIDHFTNNHESPWALRNKPIKIHKIMFGDELDELDEENCTLLTMGKYGIDNVRGGSYNALTLSENDIQKAEQIINGLKNKSHKYCKCGNVINEAEKQKIKQKQKQNQKKKQKQKHNCENISCKFNKVHDLEELKNMHGNSAESNSYFKQFEVQAKSILNEIENIDNFNDLVESQWITQDDKNRLIECIEKTVFESIIMKEHNHMKFDLILMAPLYPKDKGCYFKVYDNGMLKFEKHFEPKESEKLPFDIDDIKKLMLSKECTSYSNHNIDEIMTELFKKIIVLNNIQQQIINLDDDLIYQTEIQGLKDILDHPLFEEIFFVIKKMEFLHNKDTNICTSVIILDFYDSDSGKFYKSYGRRGTYSIG